jgi:hypothetical protein
MSRLLKIALSRLACTAQAREKDEAGTALQKVTAAADEALLMIHESEAEAVNLRLLQMLSRVSINSGILVFPLWE